MEGGAPFVAFHRAGLRGIDTDRTTEQIAQSAFCEIFLESMVRWMARLSARRRESLRDEMSAGSTKGGTNRS